MPSGVVTGSEQVSPTQTKAAPSGAAASFSCAGCDGRQIGGRGGAQHDAVEERQFQRGLREGFGVAAGDDDLGAAQPQVERVQQRHMAEQIVAGRRQDAVDQPVGLLAPFVVAGEHRQPHQVARRHRIGIGRGVVGGGMRAQQQIGGVVGGEIIAAGIGIGVMRIERALPGKRAVEEAPLAGRLVERQRGADHGGEIGGEAWKQQLPVAPGMAEPVAFASCSAR